MFLIKKRGTVVIRVCGYLLGGDVSLQVLTFLRENNREDCMRSTTRLVHISCRNCPVNDTPALCHTTESTLHRCQLVA